MDTGLMTKPTGSMAQSSYLRPEAAPVREAVATQLNAPQSVTATADTTKSRNEWPRTESAPSQTREVIVDPHSREVIFRLVDVRTGQVKQQVPDAALMRLRAYTRALADGKSPLEADLKRDSTA